MTRLIIILIIAACGLASCKKTDGNDPAALEGTWSGTFQRVLGSTGPKSHITLILHNSTYSGTSDSSNYPGICQGSFSAPAPDSISFTNTCFWPANFDWSFILTGNYSFARTGNKITITRVYPGIIYQADIYELQKNM